MKNVLLTTTALVAFAGAAAADISLSGSAGVEYNDLRAVNFTYYADVAVSATAELNDGVTAGMSYGVNFDDASGTVTGDAYPVITLESSFGKLSGGDADQVWQANDHFAATDGVADFGTGGYLTTAFAIRADASMGGFNLSVSDIAIGTPDLRVGASGSFSDVDFGFGYEDTNGDMGVNAGTTFGAFSVAASAYFGTVDSFGVSAGYAVTSEVTVGGYFASTDPATAYGVSVAYASGAITADAGYEASDDGAGTTTSGISVDGTYAVSGELMASAGYLYTDVNGTTDGLGYVAAVYDLGNGAEAYAAYSTGIDGTLAGDAEWNGGATVGVSLSF